MTIQKLRLPMRFVNGRALTVEQDTDVEIGQCIESSARTQPGQRLDLPEYGVPDQAFVQGGPSAAVVRAAILRDEPRARVLVTADPSQLDDMIGRISVEQQ